MAEQEEETSYLDYDTFLDPSFSPASFANTLVLATNNASDTPLDLTTPLSRVLFDVQEVDTHIDKITGSSALPLLSYTKQNVQASERILQGLEAQVSALSGSYERLEREVITRHAAAEEARLAGSRVWETVKLARSVSRCLALGRQLEAQMSDLKGGGGSGPSKAADFRAMVRAANTVLALRQIFNNTQPGGEGEGLEDINLVKSLQSEMVAPAERNIISQAEQIVGQFSMSSLTAQTSDGASTANNATISMTFSQAEDAKSRAASALVTLYLLSPLPTSSSSKPSFDPSLLISSLQEYLRRSITASLAGLSSGLSTLPKLDRALLEVSARCQNIVALEILLESLEAPLHPLLDNREYDGAENQAGTTKNGGQAPRNLLQPLLSSLDTASLPSYFWRSMASQLTSRVQRILREGGVSARTLRSNKDRIRDAIRQCVNRGSTLPAGAVGSNKTGETVVGNWEREAAVMVGSVVNVLGR